VGGDKLFVDYAGDTVPVIVDRLTGEVRRAQIFVAVMGASNFTYVEAACRGNRSVLYQRISKLFADRALARGDGRYARTRAPGGIISECLRDFIGIRRGSREVAAIGAADGEDAARQTAILVLQQKEGLRVGDVIQVTRI
jgi:hypothetical protein